ncbi:MAG: DUF1893 domain-containing protein [Clostridia bacterium]|nr:DUF1893 domain-containing protein [Clostridia bacterium]
MNRNQLKRELRDYALVVFKNDDLFFFSTQRGIAPLVELCDMNNGGNELFLADKVIGKAAALLCAHCGVKVLYANVISEAALAVLQQYGIDAEYEIKVPFIKNREGNDKCPMEKLAHDVSDPGEMLLRAQNFLKSLNN